MPNSPPFPSPLLFQHSLPQSPSRGKLCVRVCASQQLGPLFQTPLSRCVSRPPASISNPFPYFRRVVPSSPFLIRRAFAFVGEQKAGMLWRRFQSQRLVIHFKTTTNPLPSPRTPVVVLFRISSRGIGKGKKMLRNQAEERARERERERERERKEKVLRLLEAPLHIIKRDRGSEI